MKRPRAVAVEAIDNYFLLLLFSNGEKCIFDVKPYLDFLPFTELKNVMLEKIYV